MVWTALQHDAPKIVVVMGAAITKMAFAFVIKIGRVARVQRVRVQVTVHQTVCAYRDFASALRVSAVKIAMCFLASRAALEMATVIELQADVNAPHGTQERIARLLSVQLHARGTGIV